MEVFRKKNEAFHVIAPLIDSANRPARKSSATLAAGDIKVCRHTAGAWDVSNIGALPSEIGTTGLYDFVGTATEANPDDTQYPVIIACSDAAGAEWDDQAIIIWTRDVDMDDLALASVCTETRLAELDAANLPGVTDAIKAKTDNLPEGIKKNTALNNFGFMMRSSSTGDYQDGLTVTATRSIDGAAFGSCANSVVEIANGAYKINLADTDLNGDIIILRFTATGAKDKLIVIKTEE